METDRFIIESSGVIHIPLHLRKGSRVTRCSWDISMCVLVETSARDAEHFHIAWRRIFDSMHSELGALFCNAYCDGIRRDVFNAIRDVTDAFYCVAEASSEFSEETVTLDFVSGQPLDFIERRVRITPVQG